MLHPLEKIRNLQKISIIFFIIAGILHLGSSILIAGNVALDTSQIIHKTMDIPFAISGLIYALTSIRLRFFQYDNDHKSLDIIGVSVIIIALIILIAINILIADK